MEVEANEEHTRLDLREFPAPKDYHEVNKEDKTRTNLRDEFLAPEHYHEENKEDTRSDLREFPVPKNHHETNEEDTRSDVREFRVPEDDHNVMAINPERPNSTIKTGQYVFITSISFFSYLVDTGSDIFMAYKYFSLEQYTYFYVTIAFVGLPAVMLSLVTFKLSSNLEVNNFPLWKRILWFMLLALQISPMFWYVECIHRAITLEGSLDLRSSKAKLQIVDKIRFVISVLETAFEALPQLVLQIAILLTEGAPSMQSNVALLAMYRHVSIFISFATTVWGIVSFERLGRGARFNPATMPYVETIKLVLYIIPFIICRILAVGEAAAVYPRGTVFVCLIHWCVCYLVLCDSTFCSSSAIESFVWIFYPLQFLFPYNNYRMLSDEWHHRYYALCFLENLVSVGVWIVNYDDLKPAECQPIFRWLLPTVVMGGFFFSLIARRVYSIDIIVTSTERTSSLVKMYGMRKSLKDYLAKFPPMKKTSVITIENFEPLEDYQNVSWV